MNIVLVGYRSTGKSTVGKKLAARLNMGFVDIDDLIEKRHGISISDMVESHGWDHFRAIEKRTVKEISRHDNLVIAPGGGAILDPENVTSLKKKGLLIWLKADEQVILKRMEEDSQTHSQRPTLTGKGTLEELKEVMADREPFYEKASEAQVDTSNLSVEAVLENILSIFQERKERN